MSNAKLKMVPTRSAEREELAAWLEKQRVISQELAATEKAISTGWEIRNALREKVENATAAIETAKADAARHLTDSALGRSSIAPRTVRQARDALQDAEDELEAALTLEKSLEEQKRKLNTELASVKLRVEEAFRRAASSEAGVRAAFEHYGALRLQLAGYQRVIEALSHNGAVPDEHRDWNVLLDPSKADDTSAVVRDWEAALAALRLDADAPLPA